MIPILLALLGTGALLAVLVGVPWALTYLPGSAENRKWLKYVYDRTIHGFVHWEVKDGVSSSSKVISGRDVSKEELHELHILSKSSKFLYSYSLAGAEDDGYTHNKKRLAYIPINPWWPMHKLVKAALEQIEEGHYLPQEPVDIITPGLCPDGDWKKTTPPLFGLEWGEEPEWVKKKNVQL